MSGKLPKYIPHVSSMQSSAVFVRKHKAVKLNAKIKDSRVSRIQMWREKKPHSLEHGINAYFTKNKKQKQKNTHKKRRGRIASWVMEKFSWNASESTEMT